MKTRVKCSHTACFMLVSIKIVFVLEFTQIIENLDQKVSMSVQLTLEQFWVMPN
jgi:hypothetical protein